MLSKACIVGTYQRKLEELARFPDVELTVVVPPYWRDERGVIPLERVYTTGYDLQVLPMALNGHFHLHFYPGLSRLMRRVQPHIVHIDEEPYNLATFLALRGALRIGARPLFFTWQNLHRRYPPPFSWLERYVLHRACYAIAGNQEAVRVLRAKGYHGPVAVIPQFGVDPDLYHPAPQEGQADALIIGYVGRLVEEKGVEDLLQAVAGLPLPPQGPAWKLQIIGSGPLRERLLTLSGELGLKERVEFAGTFPSAQMPSQYRQLDVLVLPSRTRPNWKEQFGRVLVEAMACGVTVVGSDSGEIPHVIGEAGLVFPEGDVEALRRALARLLQDPALRRELGQRGRERVLEYYTQAQVARATYEVYRQIMTSTQRIPVSELASG